MNKKNKIIIAGAMMLAVATTSMTTFAANFNSPVEALASLTGKSVETIRQDRFDNDKALCQIAKEGNVLEQFKAESLEIFKDRIAKRVADGRITQKRADELIKMHEDRLALCDGSGVNCEGHRMMGYGGGYGWHGGGHGGHHGGHGMGCY